VRTTSDGKPYALLMSQDDATSIEVHPRLYTALVAMLGNGHREEGQIVVLIAGGEIKDVRVNASASILEKRSPKVSVRMG